MEEPTFSQTEVFPLIASVICRLARDGPDFVDHRSIVSAILSDSEGKELVSRAFARSSLPDEGGVASNMVAWFSQQITVERSQWADFFERQKRDGAWAYRPVTAIPPPITPDLELAAVEGNPRLFFHLRRERNPALAQAKRRAVLELRGHLACEACGFRPDQVFPGLLSDVCEIHHRVPLGEEPGPVETHLEDLAVLCPNCHRAIHRTEPLKSVEDFRDTFFGNGL